MEQNDETDLDVALWRYGIISPLLHRDANDLTLKKMLEMASSRRYVHPDGSHIFFSGETLRKWLYRYQQLGLPGLEDKPRSDKGGCVPPFT